MITLRVNPYSDTEVYKLSQLLADLEDMLECPPNANCKTCDFRHLCYDISSAKEHACKLVKEAQGK